MVHAGGSSSIIGNGGGGSAGRGGFAARRGAARPPPCASSGRWRLRDRLLPPPPPAAPSLRQRRARPGYRRDPLPALLRTAGEGGGERAPGCRCGNRVSLGPGCRDGGAPCSVHHSAVRTLRTRPRYSGTGREHSSRSKTASANVDRSPSPAVLHCDTVVSLLVVAQSFSGATQAHSMCGCF